MPIKIATKEGMMAKKKTTANKAKTKARNNMEPGAGGGSNRMMGGGYIKPKMMSEGSKGKVMHPKMKQQQQKMKMDAEYKSAGGMIYKGR